MEKRRLGFFEKYITNWVIVCMVLGVAIGNLYSKYTENLRDLILINVPIAVLIWLMIYTMMLKIDFSSILLLCYLLLLQL